ncbi:ABC transporter substrate-binding protein [Brevundimonas sp. MYb46]|nr:ABC transporter substrate-binding protein [Brevundimonas sp. MYb31]PRA28040.1 ABC transporter substrate-binding protein [Brevundimonas sp. MYb27]PRB14646.1 ABC transporter substrate-binding protein [Brevundimonas sp. MYb52]PRB36583.1 ABC transporter substrate-binding protein [Brevundimonas sp. MYb46]PRB55720.1 ABC transporter substrate-binding protein [Brevundimonas sp. MYb33]
MGRMTEFTTGRRALLLGAAALLAGAGACTRRNDAGPSSLLKDLRDRPLAVTPPVGKLSIDDSRFLIALSLIHPDPVSLLAAWAGDVNRLSPEIYAAYLEKSPALATLPKTPSSASAFNVEAVLGAQPQVALVSLDSGPTDAQAAQLEQADVRVAYIDFFQHPFENQSRSLSLLGSLIGREEQAEAYNAFRAAKLKVISDRVAGLKDEQKPTVFLEAHAGNGPDCCNSVGAGNIGDYLTFVGARNIGAEVLKQPSGKLNLEFVVERDPDLYIATGGPHLEKTGGFVVGPKYDAETSRASLRRVASRRGLSTLKAVREGKVHGLSHQLINSPIDIVATEVLARWIQPELFADLDPRATLTAINERFLAVPYRGDYWTDLVPA